MNEQLPKTISDEISIAYERILDHVEDHFLETEDITMSMVQWDDGDFRVEVRHAFDTQRPDIHHAEEIRYKQSEGEFRYANYTREHGWHSARAFNEYVIENWTPEI